MSHGPGDSVDLSVLAAQMRANSERWFPGWHDGTLPLSIAYALGLGGEVGEVLNVVKKMHRDGAPDLSDDLALELADCFTYLLLLADEAGVDLIASYYRKRRICEDRWVARVSVRKRWSEVQAGDVVPGCGTVIGKDQHSAGIDHWYFHFDREGHPGSIPPDAPAWEPGCNKWTRGGCRSTDLVSVIPAAIADFDGKERSA